MPNLGSKKKATVKVIPKPTPESKKLKRNKEVVNRMIAKIRATYVQLDKEYAELMELQGFLMAKKFKIDKITVPAHKSPVPEMSRAEIKSMASKKISRHQGEDKEAINKTKLNLKPCAVNCMDNEEEEEDSE